MGKYCTKCGEFVLVSKFPKSKKTKDGLSSWCKACFSKVNKRHYAENKEHFANTRLVRLYGITSFEYAAMYDRQSGKCAICPNTIKLYVDHCHVSNKVRALLCNKCNLGIGYFDHDPELVESAAAYLRLHNN